MSAQDNTERALRSLYVLISKSEIYEFDEDKIVIDKERITNLLSELKECIYDMMDEYEMTKESRDQAEREFRKQADEIVLDASHKAEDIYAASVMYTDEALGNVQRIMAEAEESVKSVYEDMQKRLLQERYTVQSNQTDLLSQLQDLTDTDKYVKLINERNKEIRKEKEKEQRLAARQRNNSMYADRQTEVRVDQEVLRKLGLAAKDADDSPGDSASATEQAPDENIYANRQTEVRVDQEVLRKLAQARQSQAGASDAVSADKSHMQESGSEGDLNKQAAAGNSQPDGMAQEVGSVQQPDEQQHGPQQVAADAGVDELDEEVLRRQMLERARELDQKRERMRLRAARTYADPGEISLMDLNPASEGEAEVEEIEDELIRLDLDEDYFKWKEEQDAAFDANVAKARKRSRKR